MYRSPEVDMFDISKGKCGVHWSFGCDIWALGSLVSLAEHSFSLRCVRYEASQLILLLHGRSCTTLRDLAPYFHSMH